MSSSPFSPIPLGPDTEAIAGRHRPWQGYLVALAAVLVAGALRWPLSPWLGETSPFMLFTPAVLIAAAYGGLGPGLLATLLAGIFGHIFFHKPYGSAAVHDSAEIIRLLLFLLSGTLISVLSWGLTDAWRRAEGESREVYRQVRRFRASEERYRRMFETAYEGILCLDAEHRCTYLNPRMLQVLGRPLVAVLGRPAAELVAADDRGRFEEILRDQHPGGRQVQELRFRHADGSVPSCIASMQSIFDARGAYAGRLMMVTDITEHTAQQHRLHRRLDEAQRRLAAAAAELDALLAQLPADAPARTELARLRDALRAALP